MNNNNWEIVLADIIRINPYVMLNYNILFHLLFLETLTFFIYKIYN